MSLSCNVSLNVSLSPYSNRVIGVFKEYYGLKNKQEALNKFIEIYGQNIIPDENREINDNLVADILAMSKNKKKNYVKIDLEDLDKYM